MKTPPTKALCLAVLAAGSLLAPAKPLKIYVLAGQSNMTGIVETSTLEHIKMSPDSAKEFADLFDSNGKPVELEEVRVSCWPKNGSEQMGILKPGYGGGSKESMFGPEYAFGVYMHKKLQEPILIIKCGQGGRNLHFNFRPPSAGEWTPPAGHPDLAKPSTYKPKPENPNNPKTIVSYEYKKMITHVQDVLKDLKKYHPEYNEKDGYEIAGFAWFQGWNDMIDGGVYPNRKEPKGYDQHTWLLEHLIRDVRKDLNAPKMPFVIGVMGVGGIQDESTLIGNFQAAQAAAAENPDFKGNVAALQTGDFWDHQLAELSSRANAIRKAKPDAKEKLKPLTPEEEHLLKIGVSEGDYHYLGSGKIMAGIGKGFAASMLQLEAQAK